MQRNTLSKPERLSSKKAIATLFSDGEGGFVYPFRYIVKAQMQQKNETLQHKAPVSMLVSVSKRYHKRANKRNTLKRRTREAYRLGKHSLLEHCTASGQHLDIALIYSSKESEDFKTLDHALRKIIAQIRANY